MKSLEQIIRDNAHVTDTLRRSNEIAASIPPVDIDAPHRYPANQDGEDMTDTDAFTLDSDDKADWYLKKLAAFDAEIALVQKQAAEIIEGLRRDKRGLIYACHGMFEHYMRARIAASKGKTVKLFHGSVSLRRVPMSLSVGDEQAAIAYAKEHIPDVIETKVVLDKRSYADYMKATGEVLPGIVVKPEHEKFSYGGYEEVSEAPEE